LGTHKTDVLGEIIKSRLSKAGVVLSTESSLEKNEWHGSIKERTKKEHNDE
jgi:hypothetical protein